MKYFLVLTVCIALYVNVKAQPGTLDQSFGTDGKVFSESFSGSCKAMAIQSDGKIVAVGAGRFNSVDGFLIVRYNGDGTLDSSFGDKGRVIVHFSEVGTSRIESVAVLPNGKILAAGSFYEINAGNTDVVLLQYNSNGNLDSSFGTNGIVRTDVARYDLIYDMAVQQDGKIVVAGNRVKNENDNETSFTVRYMPDGSLDNSFGEKGIVLTNYNNNIEISCVALQADGKIITGGIYNGDGVYILTRYQPNGSLDSSFGVNAIARMEFGNYYGTLADIAIQADGKIIASGNNDYVFDYHMVVARFTANGAVDSSFGGNKGYTTPFFNKDSRSYGRTALVQEDGKIIVAGTYVTTKAFFTVLRLKENGIPDSSFGENGISLTAFEDAGTITSNTALLQTDGKVVLAGTSYINTPPDYYHFILARYNNVEKVKQPVFAKIQKWQGHYGFTWDDWPGNKINHYSVERSSNSTTFSEIAQVADVPGKKKYQFEDLAPLNGTVYYKLTAVRTDGKTVTSNIVITWNTSAIKLFPNPAKTSMRIEGLPAIEKTKLTIVDLSGNTKTTATATGGNYTFNIAQLKPGNYMLRMETNGEINTRMFVKE